MGVKPVWATAMIATCLSAGNRPSLNLDRHMQALAVGSSVCKDVSSPVCAVAAETRTSHSQEGTGLCLASLAQAAAAA